MDSSSVGAGFMAVFAVSGSVVLLSHQLHKHLLSNFMKKIEFEFGKTQPRPRKDRPKKKVRFADNVKEPSSNNKEYRKNHSLKRAAAGNGHMATVKSKTSERTPLNWTLRSVQRDHTK
ncbi:hypothetical protein NMG60_11001578 [Bertholletia excelsa]